MPLLECIPNFSNGRDPAIIEVIAAAIRSVPEVYLLHVDPGPGANRTVMTFAGPPEAVVEAAFRAIGKAAEAIDMRRHHGTHPRIGATDVCPLVPLQDITMEETVAWAKRLAGRVGTELGIPVYLYEYAATQPERMNLAYLRRGEYEGLAEKIAQPAGRPDFGPAEFNARSGATVIGARDFLLAYNVNLTTIDVMLAKAIAADLRESGRLVRGHAGQLVRRAGRFRGLKAIGWFIEEYGRAQVSTNITNFRNAPLHEVYEACRERAAIYGTQVTGSELIGLVPREALLLAGQYYAEQEPVAPADERALLQLAVDRLGLAELRPFVLEERVIEYRLTAAAAGQPGKSS